MRTALLLSMLCLSVVTYSQEPAKDRARVRRTSVASQVPLRIFQGKLYDLTEFLLFPKRPKFAKDGADALVMGRAEVISVDEGRLILRLTHGDEAVWTHYGYMPNPAGLRSVWYETVCLTNFPGQAKAVDGQRISCAAFRAGRYQYTTAAGAAATVPLYDYGKPYIPGGQKFDKVTKIWGDGKSKTIESFEP